MILTVILIYGVGLLFGIVYMIGASLFLLVWLFKNGEEIFRNVENRFGRVAILVNVVYALFWFVFLIINSYSYDQTGVYVLLPQFPGLTNLSPLLMATSLFGLINIRKMYAKG